MKVLVIEDSERLGRALQEGLRRSGFVIDLAADGRAGLAFAEINEYDLIVLDLILPKLDGLSVLKNLRSQGDHTPVLILSAKDQIQDRVTGLELGADDYLVKPFAFEELVARIKVLVRRKHEVKKVEIEINGVRINTAKRHAAINGAELSLTRAEYSLLEYLALRRGVVISKGQLRDQLYDSDAETESNVIEVLVSNIRRKIREGGVSDCIQTKRGFGYYIE